MVCLPKNQIKKKLYHRKIYVDYLQLFMMEVSDRLGSLAKCWIRGRFFHPPPLSGNHFPVW
jgi:hypothetical protein